MVAPVRVGPGLQAGRLPKLPTSSGTGRQLASLTFEKLQLGHGVMGSKSGVLTFPGMKQGVIDQSVLHRIEVQKDSSGKTTVVAETFRREDKGWLRNKVAPSYVSESSVALDHGSVKQLLTQLREVDHKPEKDSLTRLTNTLVWVALRKDLDEHLKTSAP